LNFFENLLNSNYYPGLEFKKITHDQASSYLFYNPKLHLDGKKTVFIGDWKWHKKDTNVNLLNLITKEACSWGAQVLIGPYDLSTYLAHRLKIDNFGIKPFFGEPQNSKEEVNVFSECGFAPIMEYETHHYSKFNDFTVLLNKQRSVFEKSLQDRGLVIVATSGQEIEENIGEFYRATHEIFKDNFMYSNIPESSFPFYFKEILAPTVCWKTTRVLKLKTLNKIVGYTLNFKDVNLPKRLLIKTSGVQVEFRSMGLSFLALLLQTLEAAKDYESVSFCLMKKGNFPQLLSTRFPSEVHRYALMGLSLT
jgi:hypothetical protein